MATRTTTHSSRPGFVVDPESVGRTSGRQIDWANVANGYKDAQGYKRLPAGTVVGELLSTNGKVSPRVVTTNPAVGILETDAYENSDTDSLSGYGMFDAGRFYENLLPDATGGPPATLASAIKTELGVRFRFEPYGDSTS